MIVFEAGSALRRRTEDSEPTDRGFGADQGNLYAADTMQSAECNDDWCGLGIKQTLWLREVRSLREFVLCDMGEAGCATMNAHICIAHCPSSTRTQCKLRRALGIATVFYGLRGSRTTQPIFKLRFGKTASYSDD